MALRQKTHPLEGFALSALDSGAMTTARMLQRAEPFHLEVLEKGDSLFGWMDEIGELVRYGRGEWIHAGHDAPDAIYLIRRGRVGVSVGAEGAVLRAGELFGELFFDEEVRGSYLARALEESEILVVPRERVRQLLGEKGVCAVRGLIAYKRDLVFLFSR